MDFYQIAPPSLSGLGYGTATFEALEAVGFSSDEKLLLVKVTYTDDGDTTAGIKYGHFVYDLANEQYIANLNEILGASPSTTQITDAYITGRADSWEVVANVELVGSATQILKSYSFASGQGVVDHNLIATELGLSSDLEFAAESFQLTDDGRFLAIQTEESTLAPDLYPDDNGASDIYLLDRLTDQVDRVSFIGGTGVSGSVYLADINVSSGNVEVAFVTDQKFDNTYDLNSNDETLTSDQRNDLYVASASFGASGLTQSFNFDLISINPNGYATGLVDKDEDSLPQITNSGVVFSSSSYELISDDSNEALDVFISTSTGIERIALSGIDELSSGADFVGSSNSGSTIYIKTSSSELSGSPGVDQFVKVSLSDDSYEVVSNNNVQADNIVINGVVSPSGGTLAFTSLASNIVSIDQTIGVDYDLYVSQTLLPSTGKIYEWHTHKVLPNVSISSVTDDFDTATTDADGDYILNAALLLDDDISLSLPVSTRDITASDAIAVIKLATGRNPNSDGSPVSPYQYFAADVNKDGYVSAADAIAIIKMATNRTGAPEKEWLFIDEAAPLWDFETGKSLVTKTSVPTSYINTLFDDDLSEANFVGIVKGDASPSWTSDSTSLSDSYFTDLDTRQIGSTEQWWV